MQANAEQLIQVLMALMLNALDAMEAGNGTLTVRSRLGGHRGTEVVVEVQDTGVGIPRADLTKIFEPFYTTKPQGRGTGLGLSICYGIVEDHRGRIEVDSTPGLGATFRVLPPGRCHEDPRRRGRSAPSVPTSSAASRSTRTTWTWWTTGSRRCGWRRAASTTCWCSTSGCRA